MALIYCPECGRSVSDMAESCPECGYPIQEYLKKVRQPAQPEEVAPVEEPISEAVAEEIQEEVPQEVAEEEIATVAETPVEVAPYYAEAEEKKTSGKKWLIPAIIAAVVALALVVVLVIMPMVKYNTAVKAFEQGEYEAAAEQFEALGNYKDAQEQNDTSEKAIAYEEGAAAFAQGDYATAYDKFIQAGDYQDAADRAEKALAERDRENYEKGVALMAEGNYLEAADAFDAAGDFQDADLQVYEAGKALCAQGSFDDVIAVMGKSSVAEAADYINFAEGMKIFLSGDYENAQPLFETAPAVAEAGSMIHACKLMKAESFMAKGYLNTAKGLYEELPEEFTYNEISVSDRLELLKKHKKWVKLCGKWRSTNMDASVRQKHDSTGLWDQWTGDGSNYYLEVTCVINDDGTVTMKAKANFWMYTNYSTLSKYLKTSDSSATFEYTGKSVPSKIKDSYTFIYKISEELQIKDGYFKLNRKVTDNNSSMNFTYYYKSYGTYKELVEAY